MLYSGILFFFLLLGHSTVFALATDTKQPINIVADSAMIDDASGVATYKGNVLITQGSIQIKAGKVTLNYSEQQTLEKVIAEGNPVHFKQTPEGGKPDIQAKANRMEYSAEKNFIHLLQGAELSQGQARFAAERIKYNTFNGVIEADKGDNQKGRVSITIPPKLTRQKKDKKE